MSQSQPAASKKRKPEYQNPNANAKEIERTRIEAAEIARIEAIKRAIASSYDGGRRTRRTRHKKHASRRKHKSYRKRK
jgi:hypothetical protein